MVSGSSLIEAAMVSSPTGPPLNLSMIVCSTLWSTSSSPIRSTPSLARASRATFLVIEIEAVHGAEPVPEGRGEQGIAGGGADEGEGREVQPEAPGAGAFADDDIQ